MHTSVTLAHVIGVHVAVVEELREYVVQILAKAPNLAEMLSMPYLLNLCRAPRQMTPGDDILAK